VRVSLFVPCYIDVFEPQVGIATLELLRRFGIDPSYPPDQTCCGQPMVNAGCHAEAAATEAHFARTFADCDFIVVPSGSCAHQVRCHMTAVEQTEEVRAVRARTYELVEFLHDILEVEAFPWAEFPHKVSYHNNCSALRGIGHGSVSELREAPFSKPLDLLRKVKGIEIIETDLGERIQQLDDEAPSHIVVPATHKLRSDVAHLFAEKLGTDPGNRDANYLAEQQREKTRPLILNADAGMTGANFAVAETGSFVVCTNEGNADLSANVPPLHIASIRVEKIIPRMADLGVFIRLLSRSALGSPITQYTSHFRGPRQGGRMHIVLVDNGRSERLGMEQFWTSLKCIRCGACMNTCPVYRRSGGLSYGATYSGPIGLILNPTFDRKKYSALPFASTLNGSCTNVCPVKINIHEQIFAWRKELAEEGEMAAGKRATLQAAGALMSHPVMYRAATRAADSALRVLPHFVAGEFAGAWTKDGRDLPDAPPETFHSWYQRSHGKTGAE